jgi:hypothetical protein
MSTCLLFYFKLKFIFFQLTVTPSKEVLSKASMNSFSQIRLLKKEINK